MRSWSDSLMGDSLSSTGDGCAGARCGSLPRVLLDDLGADQMRQQRELAIKIRISAGDDIPLAMLPHAAPRAVAVARVETVDDIHPADHAPKDGEGVRVVRSEERRVGR